MIQVLHVAAECYPAAKTGGLADVVGSLPRYQSQAGVLSAAIIPKYALKWIQQREWEPVFHGAVRIDWRHVGFSVQRERAGSLGFPFFVVDIPGLFDRPGIYNDPFSKQPYGDEVERYLVFQQAVLQWLLSFPEKDRPHVIHCHDHHTGLIPFMVKHCPEFRPLAVIPTVFTIHNGQYQGAFSWNNVFLLPFFDSHARGLLEWRHLINPMASAIRTAWAVTTVSESYLYELHESSLGLEQLFRDEWRKEYGIVNGIDTHTWDPATDPMIHARLEGGNIAEFKRRNKQALCSWFNLPEELPLISFIGRLVYEKGADLLPDTFRRFIHAGGDACFLVLGTGEEWTQNEFREMTYRYPGRFFAVLEYNEGLSHQVYAGSDFLIMPSRIEPCGLNQMYSMRYGTLPIVRSVGGLKDTVPDIGEPGSSGRGIRFDRFDIDDAFYALYRAVALYRNTPDIFEHLRERVMALDFSWELCVDRYFSAYRRVGAHLKLSTTPLDAGASETPAATSMPREVPKKTPLDKVVAAEPEGIAMETPAALPAAKPKRTVKKAANEIKAAAPKAESPDPPAKTETAVQPPEDVDAAANQEIAAGEEGEKTEVTAPVKGKKTVRKGKK